MMNKAKILQRTSQGFILVSSLALLSVALQALINPQSVMELVDVKLTNTDAISSIRGVYAGVGLTIVISLLYMMLRQPRTGLVFLTFFWGFYGISRIITQLYDGQLGNFGTQWMRIELSCSFIAVVLLLITRNQNKSSVTILNP